MVTLLTRITQHEYTGANRCIPCTVLNVVLATAGAAIVAIWSPMIGLGTLIASLFLIHVRGYIIPGTPTLTKRYFPTVILKRFGKDPAESTIDEPISIEPERFLREANAVTPCINGTDLCLTREFRNAWRQQDGNVGNDINSDAVRRAFAEPSGNLDIEDAGDGFVAVDEGKVIHQWPSSAAVNTDVSAANLLEERLSNWNQLTPIERGRVLASLRVFREQCPDCNGSITLGQEVVESCCSSHDVVVAACLECDVQLLELEWADELQEADDVEDADERGNLAV